MKIRRDFVTNSSSSSFIIAKKNISRNQLFAIEHVAELAEKLNMPNRSDASSWEIDEDEDFVRGYTSMDNFSMIKFLEKIGVYMPWVTWSEYLIDFPGDMDFEENQHIMKEWEEIVESMRDLAKDN